jgi:hypothetical protein
VGEISGGEISAGEISAGARDPASGLATQPNIGIEGGKIGRLAHRVCS